jgi:hypothetical protein
MIDGVKWVFLPGRKWWKRRWSHQAQARFWVLLFWTIAGLLLIAAIVVSLVSVLKLTEV